MSNVKPMPKSTEKYPLIIIITFDRLKTTNKEVRIQNNIDENSKPDNLKTYILHNLKLPAVQSIP